MSIEKKMSYREEIDALGKVLVPEDSYYGAQTQRAFNNFPISGLRMPFSFIYSLALIKKCCAEENREAGEIKPEIVQTIVQAAEEVMEGRFTDQFVVDVFQTGSGTSTNMNMNEIIASRANEILTGEKGGKSPVHPNDHVNSGQSSNDVIPSAIHISALLDINNNLIPALITLQEILEKKSVEFSGIKKIGRTHLQDAVPMTLGNEFSGYTRQIELGIDRIKGIVNRMSELALGGTAVGTGVNTKPGFAANVIKRIREHTGIHFTEAANHFEAQAAQDAAVETSGALKTIAVSISKIANDIRWLASGPRCGLGEINLPSVQPGSSIMPGKVNPVICETAIQVSAQIVGNDATITIGGMGGYFELNTMLPVICYNLHQSIGLLSNTAMVLAEKCISGITANTEKCSEYIDKSLALATLLVPHTGYDRATEIAKKAYREGKTVRQIVIEESILNDNDLNDIFK